MIPDPLLDTCGPVDSLTIERALFHKGLLAWKEGERRLSARYSWDAGGRLTSLEEDGEVQLYAYGETGLKTARYRLDGTGRILGREMWEYGDDGRLERRILKTADPEAGETWTFEHDDAGRMTAERRGGRIRVEKRDRKGRVIQEYAYDGEVPDLVTEYSWRDDGRPESVVIRDPEGREQRRTSYGWDEEGRPASETVTDGDGRAVKDEVYAYGASLGPRWLERVTWIPDGKRRGKRRPSETIYRSFTLGDASPRADAPEIRSLAFSNGVYRGPMANGRPEGNGVFQYNDESRYEGEFRDGVMDGPGRLTWTDGRMLEGRFTRGLLEGDGICTWADGSRYDGSFRNGRMHGPGMFVWPDGTRFQGLFEEGSRTDQGAWERPGDGKEV